MQSHICCRTNLLPCHRALHTRHDTTCHIDHTVPSPIHHQVCDTYRTAAWTCMKNRSVWRNHSAGKWLQCPLLQLFQQQWLDHCWRISQNCVILSKTQSNSKRSCKQSTISVICLMLYMHVVYCQFISEAM